MISANPAAHSPSRSSTGSTASGRQPSTNPNTYMMSKIAVPENRAFSDAQIHSPSTMSVTGMGAFRMPSQVRCILSRENAEYRASAIALLSVE